MRLPDGTVLPPGTVRLSDGTVAAARPPAPAQHPAPTAAPAMGRWRPMHAVIGDELRKPVLWCEFGPCVARFTDDDALGERDLRARALAAGWCYDALGRLACPSCAQYDAAFW
ncbi:MAG TPA: hypothetical protein VHF26_07050, partial [Trebonia sp.]|nr:hypothetical protein [Trebonia sp.]